MKWFTSDLHFAHPFVAALRGYALPGYAKDASIKQQAEHEHKPLKNCVDWRKHDADIMQKHQHVCWRGRRTLHPRRHQFRWYVERRPSDNAHPKPACTTQTQTPDSRQPRTAQLHPHAGKVGKRVRGSRNGRHHRNQRRVGQQSTHGIFKQGKPLGAVSTNWNAPELAEYAIPRMNNTLLLHGHTHAHDPLEFGRHHNEINVGLDAWRFEPVNEAELVDNWLQTASGNV